jgi:tetratricopeptide (TPR) repeat protein
VIVDERRKDALLEHLRAHPDDVATLIDLGNLAYRTGYRAAARTAYARAVFLQPSNVIARVNLGNALLDAGDVQAARGEYEAALTADPDFAPAHQGLSYVYDRLGEEQRSKEHRDRGFAGHPYVDIPFTGSGSPVRVLVLISAAGGNFNTEWLLDPHRYAVTRLAAEYADPNQPLPEHDVLVNAIGDVDRCAGALAAAAAIAAQSPRRVINPPQSVRATSRLEISRRLQTQSALRVPRILLLERERLEQHDLPYPVLVRTPGHHTGRHFVKADTPADLRALASRLPGDLLYVIEYVDVCGADGYARKYRMMTIGGTLLPVHAAVSPDWKVHVYTSGMELREAHRAEDEAFLADPGSILSPAQLDALRAAFEELALDYAGIDFGIDAGGRLVIFEANATMSITPGDPDERFAYRRTAVRRLFTAFDEMLAS